MTFSLARFNHLECFLEWLNPTWALVFVAIVAILVAIYNVWHTRSLAKQNATLDFLNDYNKSKEVSAAFAILNLEIKKTWGSLNKAEQSKIKYLFNCYEILAVGIEHKIYDIEMVKNTLGTDLGVSYKEAKGYIDAIREEEKIENKDTLESYEKPYSEFQKLADKIKKSP